MNKLNSKLRFAIIGCGSIGCRHISNLLKLGCEVVAWNRGEKRRNFVKKKFNIQTFKKLNEMLDAVYLNGVVVCSPNSFHLKHAKEAAKRNINLFIEKPLATSLNGLSSLENLVTKKNLISHVGSNMRFDFGPKFIKKHLSQNTIGNPLWANFWGGMYLPDWHPSENYKEMYSAKKNLGGGVIMDFIHEIDLILWMFKKPKKIAAMLTHSKSLKIETEDIVDVIMDYQGGFKINLHLDYLQKPFERGIHIVGDKGRIKWDLKSKNIEIFKHKSNKIVVKNYPTNYEKNIMYIDQMKYFIDCVKHKKYSISDISAGKIALKLALDIKKSANFNQFILT